MEGIDFTKCQSFYIYFVKFESPYYPKPVFKIGITTNLENRLLSLKAEFRISSCLELILSLKVRCVDIESQLIELFTNKFPHLKIEFNARETRKTECFIYDDSLLDLVKEVKSLYIKQTLNSDLEFEYKESYKIEAPSQKPIQRIRPLPRLPPIETFDIQEMKSQIRNMATDCEVSLQAYCDKILEYYYIQMRYTRPNARSARGEKPRTDMIRIYKKGQLIKNITDHNTHPFCLLTEEFYNDEEVRAFLVKWNLTNRDTRIHNIIYYNFKTQNTRKNNTQIKIKSLTKLSKSEIVVDFDGE